MAFGEVFGRYLVRRQPSRSHGGELVMTFFVKLVIALLFHNHLFRVLDKGAIFFQALKSRLVAGFSGTGLIHFW